MKVGCVEDLGDIILEEIGGKYDIISVLAGLDDIWKIFMYLINEYDIAFDFIDIDKSGKDCAYYLSVISYNNEYEVNIEPAYNYAKGTYFSTDGKVYVDKDIYPEYIKDISKNKYVMPIIETWSIGVDDDENPDFNFCIDDDEMGFCVCHDCKDGHHSEFKYRGNKKLSGADINKILHNHGWN